MRSTHRLSTNGPMARTVSDLAMLLSVQAGHDPRVPLSNREDAGAIHAAAATRFPGHAHRVAGRSRRLSHLRAGRARSLPATRSARSKSLGCTVEEAKPDYPNERVWTNWTKLRAWQSGAPLAEFYKDPATARADEARSAVRGRELAEADGGGDPRRLAGAHAMVPGGAPLHGDLRVHADPIRAALPVRRQAGLAARDRRQADAVLLRLDGRAGADHDVVHAVAERAGRVQRARPADGHADRRDAIRRISPACSSPMPTSRRRIGSR